MAVRLGSVADVTSGRKGRRCRIAAVKLVLVLVALLLVAGAGNAGAAGPKFFQTPSHNIGCVWSPPQSGGEISSLRCDIGSGLKPLPPRPQSCDLDWGFGYTMRAIGLARPLCAGDTARDPRAPILKYGSTWSAGGITCSSTTNGLRCKNTEGHGWFLSRQHSYRF
jgi:hypothetical protein